MGVITSGCAPSRPRRWRRPGRGAARPSNWRSPRPRPTARAPRSAAPRRWRCCRWVMAYTCSPCESHCCRSCRLTRVRSSAGAGEAAGQSRGGGQVRHLPLPRASTAFVAKPAPLPCASAAREARAAAKRVQALAKEREAAKVADADSLKGGESRPTAATTVENRYCSCRLTRVWPRCRRQVGSGEEGLRAEGQGEGLPGRR